MQLSPALCYSLLLKAKYVLLSTLYLNTLYVPLIRETYFYIHKKLQENSTFRRFRKVAKSDY
jgi:hypothetical protein